PYTKVRLCPHVQEEPHGGMVMVDAALVEVLAEVLCGLSAVLFTFIATLSRSPRAEATAQTVIFILLMSAAAVLWLLPSVGGSLWGSSYLPRPLALFCIILAISARMNIKGENISFGANPHSIGRNEEE
ncbi:MAG: hypothetical protein L7U25_00225, partial [Candidatus Poseidonia sp.]|nr:hypothetical protein [Poseidonia sp.]